MPNPTPAARPRLWPASIDGWAVSIALFVTLLVRLGVLKRVPW